MQKETSFKMKVQSKLNSMKKLGLWYYKVQQVSVRGIPDIIMCAQGRLIAWELKVGKNKATELQDYVLKQIAKANGWAKVVTPETFDKDVQQLESILKHEGTLNEMVLTNLLRDGILPLAASHDSARVHNPISVVETGLKRGKVFR